MFIGRVKIGQSNKIPTKTANYLSSTIAGQVTFTLSTYKYIIWAIIIMLIVPGGLIYMFFIQGH